MPIYIKIDGIEGSVTESTHKDQIEAESFSFGVSRALTHVAGGASEKMGDKPQFQELTFTKRQDKSSVKLFSASCEGKHIAKGTVFVVGTQEGSAQEFSSYELEDILVSNFAQSGHGSDLPHETVSLNFTKVTFKLNSRDEKGKTSPSSSGWDIKQNKKV
jgi:type VI secretion system secreted protein Hcp